MWRSSRYGLKSPYYLYNWRSRPLAADAIQSVTAGILVSGIVLVSAIVNGTEVGLFASLVVYGGLAVPSALEAVFAIG